MRSSVSYVRCTSRPSKIVLYYTFHDPHLGLQCISVEGRQCAQLIADFKKAGAKFGMSVDPKAPHWVFYKWTVG